MADLVVPNKYYSKILLLPSYKRISVEYPLLVRDEVAKRLAKVAKRLPANLLLKVDDGFRSIRVQEFLWKNRLEQFEKESPSLSEKQVRSKLKDFVFEPRSGTPPHSTGGAVDVSLCDKDGKDINLSAPFEKYYSEPYLKSSKISKVAQKRRLLLNKLMLEQGFAPNPKEYWHFSYGDESWAKYYKKEQLFSTVELPKELYYPKAVVRKNKIIRRLWKVINAILRLDTSY